MQVKVLPVKNYVYFAVFAVDLCAFSAGTAASWPSPMLPKLKDDNVDNIPFGRKITSDEEGWIASLHPLGAVVGPFLFALVADRFGRKPVILSLAVPLTFSFVLLGFGKSIWLYYVARVFQGLSTGGMFAMIPMYIGEVSEPSNRGMLGTSMNIFYCSGQVLTYAIGPYLSIAVFHVIMLVFPVLFFAAFFIVSPESPYFLVRKSNYDARNALVKLRGHYDIEIELEDIQKSQQNVEQGSFSDVFKSKALRKAFAIALALVFIMQFSGILVVLFYAQDIFEATGDQAIPAETSSLIIGIMQLLAGFVTPFVLDRGGRKILLIISCIGVVISEVPLGLFFYLDDHDQDTSKIMWLPLVSLISYIIWYSIGIGPLPWTFMGELFPANVKFLASSLISSILCIIAFLNTKYFSSVSDAIGLGPTFWIYAGLTFLGYLVVQFYVIETKGKTFLEIQEELAS